LEIRKSPAPEQSDPSFIKIDRGERAAILLALSLHADLLLMDDRRGVTAAERSGLRVTGTIGVLDLAAERGLIEFSQAIHKLDVQTSGGRRRYSTSLLRKYST
jgi:predicted nucleic acid-binding protein